MIHDAFLIAGLKARKSRTAVCRWFHIAGTDPSRDRSFSLRMYQIYVSVMVAAALAAIWFAALAQVEVVAAPLSVDAAEAIVKGLGLAAAALLGVSCLKALRGGPFSFSDADVAFLLTGPIRLQLVLVAELLPDVAKAALVGALIGFAAGVGCATAGLAVDPFAMAVDTSLLLATVSGASWVVGVSRVFRCKAGPDDGRTGKPPLLFERRWVRVLFGLAIGAASLAGIACAPLMSGEAVLRCVSWQTAPLIADVLVAEVALVFALGRRADAAALSQESLLSVEVPAIGLMTGGRDAALRDAVHAVSRRRKVSARRPSGQLPQTRGAAVIAARAGLSLRRQREGWPSLVLAGAFLAPVGAYALMEGAVAPGLLLLWLAMPQFCIRDVREIARCFRDDLRLRCVRDRLPLATAAIFALDVLPFLAVVLSIQAALAIVSVSLAIALGTPLATALPAMICLAVLLTVGLTLCCAFDAVRMPFGARRVVGCEWAAFAFAGATAAAAMIGLPPLLLAAFVAALDVALAAGIARVLR